MSTTGNYIKKGLVIFKVIHANFDICTLDEYIAEKCETNCLNKIRAINEMVAIFRVFTYKKVTIRH